MIIDILLIILKNQLNDDNYVSLFVVRYDLLILSFYYYTAKEILLYNNKIKCLFFLIIIC